MNLPALHTFHKSRTGHLVFGLVELGLAYLLGLWALDSGSLWIWILTVIFVFGFLQNLVRLLVGANNE